MDLKRDSKATVVQGITGRRPDSRKEFRVDLDGDHIML